MQLNGFFIIFERDETCDSNQLPSRRRFDNCSTQKCYSANSELVRSEPSPGRKTQRGRFDKIMSLVTELERLADGLGENPDAGSPISWPVVAERIANNLGVKPDEVGILGLSARWRHLYFLVPEALKNVGFIPLTSTSALAARTARESRPEINNLFSNAKHATVFEGVKTGGETAEAIQKIISAPILAGGKVIGVIQISRKGANVKTVGPDFTPADLGKVLALCRPLGKLLEHFARD